MFLANDRVEVELLQLLTRKWLRRNPCQKKPGLRILVTRTWPSSRSVGDVGTQVAKAIAFSGYSSVFSNKKLVNQPSKESSTHDGAWVRAQTCLLLKTYSSRFAELFDNKALFDRWVRSMSRAGKWVDGKAIQATAEKIGQLTVIWEEKQRNDVTL